MNDDIPILGDSTKKRAGRRGLGRPKGSRNRIPASVKEMVLEALRNVGGDEYLERQAVENPAAFLGLIGKLLPADIKVDTQPTFVLVNAIPLEDDPKPLPGPNNP